jgi:hypothetical protein
MASHLTGAAGSVARIDCSEYPGLAPDFNALNPG